MLELSPRLREPSHNIFLTMPNALDALFCPKSVAVIGASEKKGSVGRTILWNLLSSPFGGTLYPINPKRDNVLGVTAYPSLSALPQAVDLVVIVTPSATVPELIKEAVACGVKAAIVISAGFKEIGPEGVELERQILEVARPAGLRVVGPNCLGVMNTTSGLNATFASGIANPGHVAFISQSGALCTAVLDWSLTNNVGFSVFASIGSMLDVGWGDLITYLGDDPNTKSIVIYMESIGDASAFLSAAREVALEKPIIVIKPGRTESAAKAAASHTGSLVGSDAVLDAAFKRAGVLRLNTIEELFAMAEVLDKQPLPQGSKLTIITNAGGPGVIATDALISAGGDLADVPQATQDKLSSFLPPSWSHGNPIDVLGDASPERYAQTLAEVMNDPASDGTLVILTPQAMTDPTPTAQALVDALKTMPQTKPVLASWMGGKDVRKGEALLNKHGIPTFQYPDTAARAFAHMWTYSKNLKALYETPSYRDDNFLPKLNSQPIDDKLMAAREEGRTILTELEAKDLLKDYGINTTHTVHATTAQQAVEAAEAMGYPVVLKLHSLTITHKSDVGGVQLNLTSATDVEKAYKLIERNLAERGMGEGFQGVTVQPMVKLKGLELLLGSTNDPQFGPVIAFGAGGTSVELFHDVAFALPPLNSTLVNRLIEQTKVYKALHGFRGSGPIDFDQLEALLIRFSFLLIRHPVIAEIEINPLLASEDTLIALDARVVLHNKDVDLATVQRNVIRAYPHQHVEQWTNAKANTYHIRPIRPADETLMAQFHATLSEQSVYYTFAHQFPLDERITHQRLMRVCFNDFGREITMVTIDETKGCVAGVGRLSRYPQARHTGLFRLIVSDDYQRQGLGDKLLNKLIDIATQEGMTTIKAQLLPDNAPIIALCEKAGFTLVPAPASQAGDPPPFLMATLTLPSAPVCSTPNLTACAF
jgi:acetyltransferase